jgi:hypothetical protein
MWLAFLVSVFSLLYGFTGFAVWHVGEDPVTGGSPAPDPDGGSPTASAG